MEQTSLPWRSSGSWEGHVSKIANGTCVRVVWWGIVVLKFALDVTTQQHTISIVGVLVVVDCMLALNTSFPCASRTTVPQDLHKWFDAPLQLDVQMQLLTIPLETNEGTMENTTVAALGPHALMHSAWFMGERQFHMSLLGPDGESAVLDWWQKFSRCASQLFPAHTDWYVPVCSREWALDICFGDIVKAHLSVVL